MTPQEHTADLDRAERNAVFLIHLKDRFDNYTTKLHAGSKAHHAEGIAKNLPLGDERTMWLNLGDAIRGYQTAIDAGGAMDDDTERALAHATISYLRIIHDVKLVNGRPGGILQLQIEYKGLQTWISWNSTNVGFMCQTAVKPTSTASEQWVMWHDA